jgi:hypothetical protein
MKTSVRNNPKMEVAPRICDRSSSKWSSSFLSPKIIVRVVKWSQEQTVCLEEDWAKIIKRSSKCYLLNMLIFISVVLNIYLRGRTFVLLTNRSLQLQTISNKRVSPFRSLVHIQLYSIHNYRHPRRHIFCRLCSIIRKCIFKRLGQKVRTSNFTSVKTTKNHFVEKIEFDGGNIKQLCKKEIAFSLIKSYKNLF